MKNTTILASIVASLILTSTSANSATVLLDDFTSGAQAVEHRIGGSLAAKNIPTLVGGFVFSNEVRVTGGTEFPVVKRYLGVRQSGTIGNNNSKYVINPTHKYYDSADTGSALMGVDALYFGHSGDLKLVEAFTPIDLPVGASIKIWSYGVCAKISSLTVTANNGASVKIAINPHVAGVDQVYTIPVAKFNQPGFPVLNSLSNLTLDTTAVESTRYTIQKIQIDGVSAFPTSCPLVNIAM